MALIIPRDEEISGSYDEFLEELDRLAAVWQAIEVDGGRLSANRPPGGARVPRGGAPMVSSMPAAA
jgi:hypothetical protein